MQNKTMAGRLASFSHRSPSPLFSIAFYESLQRSIHPSLQPKRSVASQLSLSVPPAVDPAVWARWAHLHLILPHPWCLWGGLWTWSHWLLALKPTTLAEPKQYGEKCLWSILTDKQCEASATRNEKSQRRQGCILLVALELKHFFYRVITLWFAQVQNVIYRFTGTWKRVLSMCHCEGNNQGTCSKVGEEGECLLKLFQNNTGSQ